MNRIIPNGTEVLIFYYNEGLGPNQDVFRFIKGIVESSETIEIPTMHGSPWDEVLYKVLGEDNNIYYGNYGSHITGNYYFRTAEDHIIHLKNRIKNNCDTINNLDLQNSKLYDLMEDLRIKSKEADLNTFDNIDNNVVVLNKSNKRK